MPDWMDDDDLLLAELGEAMRAAQVPARMLDDARAAYAWRTIDAELAALTHDSTEEPELLAGVRGSAREAVRILAFVADSLTIELDLSADGVVGQFVPPQPGEIEVRGRSALLATLPVDDLGRFSADPAPAEPFRLYCRTVTGVRVVTDWITP